MIPTLQTERLILRAPEARDLDPYAEFLASQSADMIGGPFDRADAWLKLCAMIGHWSLRGYGRWALEVKGHSISIGTVGLYFPEGWPEPEIAWSVFSAGEGKGYAFEAAQAARDYAYNILGWPSVISLVDDSNTRSVALAERMGATRDGVHHHPKYGALTIWRHIAPKPVA